jgi:hypothetical protein
MLTIEAIKSMSIGQVKSFCSLNEIEVFGDKRYLQTWINAAIEWINSQPVQESIETVKTATVNAIKTTCKVLTSDKAKEVYTTTIAYLIVGFLLMWRLVGKGVTLLWDNRSEVPYLSYFETKLIDCKTVLIDRFEFWCSQIEIAENKIDNFGRNLIGSVYKLGE